MRSGSGKQIALGIVRPQTYEDVLLLLRLDALCDDEYVVLVRITDDMAKEAFVTGIRIYSANVFHIYFNEVRSEIHHTGQVRVIGSEIIYGDFAAKGFEFVRNRNHQIAFRSIHAFEDFENHP